MKVHFYILLVLLCVAGFSSKSWAAKSERVTVGAHINDIQEINLQSHSYRLDMYIWFRWRNPALDPSKTAEFMNAFDPADHVLTPLYAKPQKMPDGSLYMIIRDQGKFSAKFPLQQYPFDRQQLAVTIEDSVHDASTLVYVPDTTPVSLSARVYLPGFNIGTPALDIADFAYPTTFGDISQAAPAPYSRAVFTLPVARPQLATGVKVFLPVVLILICTGLVFFVHPAYIEGRLGVAITALLTLVALQLTTTSSLPDVDYLLITDKVYLLSYLFVIATLTQVVRLSRLVHSGKHDVVRASDRAALFGLAFFLLLGMVGIFWVMF